MRKAWWVAAPVAVALMVGASMQPYFSIVRPWTWSDEELVSAGGEGSFAFPIADVEGAMYQAQVSVLEFQELNPKQQDVLEAHAPEGFSPWLVLTEWSAPQESVLAGCRMWVTASDGREYQLVDRAFVEPVMQQDLSTANGCTLPGQGGPLVGDGEIVEGFGDPRPDTWRKLTPIAMPDGVQPLKLHVGWEEPHYVTLVLPEPEPFGEFADGK